MSHCPSNTILSFLLLAVIAPLLTLAQETSESADPGKYVEATPAQPVLDESERASAPNSNADSRDITSLEQQVNDEVPAAKMLLLLDGVVEPGKSQILNWEFESDFADISAPVPVLVVNGAKPGPTLCLTAAVHGDELNGIEIVRRVIYELDAEKLSGAVIGVPIVNLEGFKRSTRYLPDRRDLNRYFPGRRSGSYASRIAHSFFSDVIVNCNYLIDIHTGSLSRTNLPQIRADLTNASVASLAENMGSIVVLQSKGARGTLRRAAADAGIPAVTLETGAPNNLQRDAVEQGVKTISSALSSLGLSEKSFWKRSSEPVFYRSKWIRARDGGILFSKVELGDSVKEGTVLGLLSNPITNKTSEILSPIEGRVLGMALNQVMYPGFAAYHIGLKSSIVEAAEPEDLVPEEEDMAEDEMENEELEIAFPDNSDLQESGFESVQQPADNGLPKEAEQQDKSEESENSIEKMELPTADKDSP